MTWDRIMETVPAESDGESVRVGTRMGWPGVPVESVHKACPFCSGRGSIEGPVVVHPNAARPCEDCGGSGLAITWKVRAWLVGGHYRVQVFAGRPGSRANLGTLIMDEADMAELQQQGLRMVPPLEVELLGGPPGWEPAEPVDAPDNVCPTCDSIRPARGVCRVCDETDV